MNERILAIDDEAANRFLLENTLSDFQITTASDGNDMWEKIGDCNPSLILMDIMLPGKNGYQLAAELASHEKYFSVPIIFLTARTDPDDVVKGFEAGGYDYIKKPFNETELIARIRAALKKADEKEKLARDLIIDPNTGLYNRRYLEDFIKRESNKIMRNLSRFSIAMIDIDFFKILNDEFGHQCGDFILKEFSIIIKNSLREYDIPVRFGGEEFLVIMPSIDRSEAYRIISRIKKNHTEHEYNFNGKLINFTFTSGLADFNDFEEPEPLKSLFTDLIKKADSRLYIGKKNGRNKIVIED